MVEAILFDLDETLILDEAISEAAFLATARLAKSVGADPERLAKEAGIAAKRLWAEGPFFPYCHRIGHSAWEGLWARYEPAQHPDLLGLRQWAPAFRANTWRSALAEQGITATDLPFELADQFMHRRRQYPLFPEIPALLAALHPRFRLGIVTNGVPDLQREKLAGCGVGHLFQAVIVSGEADCGKPDPGIFRSICQELGVEPEACVMVGDNPERDVAGARAAKMRSVWVQRSGRPRDERFSADLECTDLSALLPWLEGVH